MQVLLWLVVLSLFGAAAALGVIAWRMARSARERESARAELLKTLAFPDLPAVPAPGPSISDPHWTPDFLSEDEAPIAADDAHDPPPAPMFGERENVLTTFPRRWISLFAVGAAIALVVTLHATVAGRHKTATAAEVAPAPSATPAPASANTQTTVDVDSPIELIALQYHFGKADAFDVKGLVHNPVNGRVLTKVSAVVDLLDSDGRVLTSKTTPLERHVLEAGQSSSFSMVFPRVTGNVASYQVGFRSNDGETVLQVDHRAPEPAGKAPSF